MMGLDVERMLAVVNNIKDEAAKQINTLVQCADDRMETIDHSHNVHVVIDGGPHGHPDGSHHHDHWYTGHGPTGGQGKQSHVSDQLTYPVEYGDDLHPSNPHKSPSIIYEREKVELSIEYVGNLISMGVVLGSDTQKMNQISNEMYTDVSTFNNSYGSPWTEINMLKQKIDEVEQYATANSVLQWKGQKFALVNLLQVVVSYALDCKFSLSMNQDFVQRGYDHEFNGNETTIAWEDFDHGATTGNRNQNTPGATNLRRKSRDPF